MFDGTIKIKPPYPDALTVALDLIDRGIRVFPVELREVKDKKTGRTKVEKRPAITNFRNLASLNPCQIRTWFGSGLFLPGVPTGIMNGFDVVDIDPRHGGDVWLREHEAELPVTRRHNTLQGGVHLLLRHHEGMRDSIGHIAPGVDVKAESGCAFIVWWPALGLPSTDAPIAPWPRGLAELAMAGRARRGSAGSGATPLSDRKPPSARAVIALLNRMPNPLHTSRDTYVILNLATKGCIDALIEADELTPEDEIAIEEAAIQWCYRWEGHDGTTDEAAKWDEDWRYRDAKLAGWQTLQRLAGELIPGYREEQAKAQFAEPSDESPQTKRAYQGNPHWPSMLQVTKGGAYRLSPSNLNIALRHAPEWQGVLGFDELANSLMLRQRPPYERDTTTQFAPRAVKDKDVLLTMEWMNQRQIYIANKHQVHDAMQVVATPYHPVREYLDSLIWDGQARLDTWVVRHLGVEDTPLHRAYGSRFLISAVARVRQPGCQVDNVLVLEGPQNLGKSTTLRTLADPWFTDHVPDLHSKDAQLQLEGVWLVEFAELGQFGRADSNRAKIFISIQKDRFRRPYGVVAENATRQCVFVVTLNPSAHGYLKDETGNRRFWPALCAVGWPEERRVDREAVARERDQLWAEADYRFGQGELWWLHEAELLDAHEDSIFERLDLDPIHWDVADVVRQLADEGNLEPSYKEIRARLGLPGVKDASRDMQTQIGRTMTRLGFTKKRVSRDGEQVMIYLRRSKRSRQGE